MTYQTLAGNFVIGGYFIFMHIGEYGFEDLLILGSTESAVCIGNDGMGASGIETGDDITVSISSYWKGSSMPTIGCMRSSMYSASNPPIRIRLLRIFCSLKCNCSE